MGSDFPAAHSMDATWFAVDRDGHVAVLRSGGEGPVPCSAAAWDEAYTAIETWVGGRQVYRLGYDTLAHVLNDRGWFRYEHDFCGEVCYPYDCHPPPSQPIHVDELPPPIRQAVKQTRFQYLCFAEAAQLQPWDHVDCIDWQLSACAYASPDLEVICPIPGREEAYRVKHEELLRDYAELAKRYPFEPPPRSA